MRGENSAEALGKIFQDILQTEVSPDGLSFDPNSVKVEPIREDKKYGGLRVHLLVLLERARIPLQIDVGFGDQISPGPEEISFPSLLGQETSRLDAYPKETVIAEKLEAMISLGEANSRMKDFYDIHFLSQHYGFKGEILSQAVEGTFTRRKTPIPEEEIYPLSRAFSSDPIRQRLWAGFLKRLGLKGVENTFEEVCRQIAVFVLPPLQAVRRKESFRAKWAAGGPWK